jgi:hypothetical protein
MQSFIESNPYYSTEIDKYEKMDKEDIKALKFLNSKVDTEVLKINTPERKFESPEQQL